MFRSPLTFARWYRDNSAQGFVMQGISGPINHARRLVAAG